MKPPPHSFARRGKLRVSVLERELCDRGDVRAEGHHGRPVRREVAGRDVVRSDDQHLHLQGVRQLLWLRRRLDVRPARDLDRLGLFCRHGPEDVRLDDGRVALRDARAAPARASSRGSAISPFSIEAAATAGRAEIDLVVGGAASPREVAVERAQRVRARRRRLPHPDAWPARGLEHPDPGHQQVDVSAGARDLVENLPRARRRSGRHEVLGQAVATQGGADDRHVVVGRVDRGADADLRERGPDDLFDGNDVARARGLRDQRPELAEVDVDLLVEVAGVAGRHGLEVVRALLLLEPEPRRVVRGEDPSRRAQLGDHVGDRAPLGVAQRGHAGARELEEAATAAAHALFRSSSRMMSFA